LTLVASGCGATDEPTTEPEPAASNGFELKLPDSATAETVIPAIVEAGHDQLAMACEASPVASVRIFNPLAAGSYEDIACSTLLDAEASVGPTSEGLVRGDERIGEAQQRLTPIGLGCSFVILGLGIFMNHALCQYPGAEHPGACAALSEFGMGGLGLACAFI
jgi:hypothetical protein